ncbi:hypothetical protein SSP35_15_00540 [Streptomyces sp. NBRC 110611]|uniref:hypothetical protein n=1 Tax=Streptomyces sp. NBRC 110611 TaxID=1621259 RepID=UPI000856394D|nr:hypothetical protein [Streptomyces sp. NBRC 110611]GAU69899.1 hypothetical protein SSP35_15_00540 [Streptomyces sp. NBRC 110611]
MTDSDQAGSTPGLPPTPPPLPPRPAETGPRPVPANEAEALEIGRQHFPTVGTPGGPASLHVHEFDIAYLIQAGWPPRADPTAPPAEPGGSNVVISKADGEVTYVPNFPPESAMRLYRRLHQSSPPEEPA